MGGGGGGGGGSGKDGATFDLHTTRPPSGGSSWSHPDASHRQNQQRSGVVVWRPRTSQRAPSRSGSRLPSRGNVRSQLTSDHGTPLRGANWARACIVVPARSETSAQRSCRPWGAPGSSYAGWNRRTYAGNPAGTSENTPSPNPTSRSRIQSARSEPSFDSSSA